MDPTIANMDLRPPPEPRVPYSVLLAILVNVLLIAAVAWGIQSRPGAGKAAPASPQTPATGKDASPAVAQARTDCPLRPLLAAVGPKDGQLFPPMSVAGKTEKDIDALLVAGKEAAAAGLVRDAEVAYLTSCRVADALKGAGSVESANARYQLARHYVAAAEAASTAPAAQRAEVLEKAQAYYEDSLQRFRVQLGDSHEKTRFAAAGLDAARVALKQTTQPAPGPETVAAARMNASPVEPAAAKSQPHAAPALARAQRQSAPKEQRQSQAERTRLAAAKTAGGNRKLTAQTAKGQTTQVQMPVAASTPQPAESPSPSFDCMKARSYAERTICADSELAHLDRDLGRLYARAKRAADDPAAFRRHSDAEWSRREKTCRDRDCLVRWYAERRQQLTASLSEAATQTDRTASR
jgi:hypothetical protein